MAMFQLRVFKGKEESDPRSGGYTVGEYVVYVAEEKIQTWKNI